MTFYAAFLRAMNVGGTGKLPMAELRRMGTACGFANVRTHIASGNLLFESPLPQEYARDAIGAELEKYFGKAVPVFVRSAAELEAVLAANPFPEEKKSRLMVFFLAEPATPAMLAEARGRVDERMALGEREIFVAYGGGMGATKLVIPAAKQGTARNLNTVSKVAAMLRPAA